jgi:hypothetical protein
VTLTIRILYSFKAGILLTDWRHTAKQKEKSLDERQKGLLVGQQIEHTLTDVAWWI